MAMIAIGFLLHWLPKSTENKVQDLMQKLPLVLYPILVMLVALLLFQFSKVELSPFIYFQF
jgi:hypothetical protein